ncbi:MAG: COR domain-containing protein, partial [Bacteroidota bacterium]
QKKVIDVMSQKILLGFLHDLGIVLNYDKLSWHNTQVLNPLWLTNAVYRIINSPKVSKANGKFHLKDLEKIINDPYFTQKGRLYAKMKIPTDKFMFIVDIMEEFKLVYALNRKTFIVPDLLPIKQQPFVFESDQAVLRFIIEYPDFLPPSILPKLIVELHKYLYNDQVWRTGMVLHDPVVFKSRANVILDKDSQKIEIEISGERRREFLSIIRTTLKAINKAFTNLEMREWVPLPDKMGDKESLVDYQELIGLEEFKQEYYTSGVLKKQYKVLALLNGVEKSMSLRKIKGYDPIKIFISYSHKDREYKEELEKHLMPLVRMNSAHVWTDGAIQAGQPWEKEIFSNLSNADIVLCLISSDFIASDFCYEKELKAALEAHQAKTQTVIPIRIRRCKWERLDISQVQGVPEKWMTRPNNDDAWVEVISKIEASFVVVEGRKLIKLADQGHDIKSILHVQRILDDTIIPD